MRATGDEPEDGHSEAGAEEQVLEVLDGLYGEDAQKILDDLRARLGLDAGQILDILTRDPGDGGAYQDPPDVSGEEGRGNEAPGAG